METVKIMAFIMIGILASVAVTISIADSASALICTHPETCFSEGGGVHHHQGAAPAPGDSTFSYLINKQKASQSGWDNSQEQE
jgi:predicted cobalt transporter CbtA